jgi:Cu(I)/Ag(I) efflux system membrane fusion protein
MNRFRRALLSAALVAAGIAGIWISFHEPVTRLTSAAEPAKLDGQQPADRPVSYYQDPDGKPLYSAEPTKTPDGRSYLPVFADGEANTEKKKDTAQAAKRILYYRNPMGLPDTSKTPKKDSMGMDYIAVYEGEQDDSSEIKLSSGKVQRSGVKTELASRRVIAEPVRAPGTIQLDERRVSVISMRTEAFVDKVENVTTGSEVRKGQPLMTVYSPDIVTAASDYVASGGFKDGSAASGGARQRLLNYAVSPQVIAEMERTKRVPLTFTWYAPNDGIVLERNIVDGARVRPGDVLFRLADHSVMWAMVDVAERDLAKVAEGQPVKVKVRSYPDKSFSGTVALVYPHLNPASRSVRVRIELSNTDALLRPDMYAEAEIDTGSGREVVAVPDSAVIDSGDRQVVIVAKAEGRFDPRPVELGRRGAGYVEISKGVAEGEQVVTSANFLIDAESNLKAALLGMSDAGAPK